MDFHPNVQSWNNMKTAIFTSTGADIEDYLYLKVLYIYFALDHCTSLRPRVIPNINNITII